MRNFIVTIEGKQYQVGVEEISATPSVQTISAPVATPAPATQAPATPAPAASSTPKANVANGTKVEAPMPGLIKKLSLAEGSQVKKDQVILVLEAMKMDNDITAPCDGVISYSTSVGSNVDTGAVLAVIS